ncbi:MAG TPA: hypothetical protein VK503_07265, partial [Candidatus Bathyarchaeia archaeon]|nr:hypothetical protein [Candidatus Bathyarchaeia archaeon]
MATAFTDLEALIIIAIVLIVVYIIGTYWKHRTLTSYAHWFDENLSKKGKVKFASHGHAGLRIKYEEKDRTAEMREMDFALTLGARENLIYYPYSIFTRDFDKLSCWALLSRPIRSNLKIMRRTNRKIIEEAENTPRLSAVGLDELEQLGYVMYATDREYARELASKASIATRLKNVKNVEFIEFDRLSSRLHLVGKLSKES